MQGKKSGSLSTKHSQPLEEWYCANAKLLLHKSIQRIILATTVLNINMNANGG